MITVYSASQTIQGYT